MPLHQPARSFHNLHPLVLRGRYNAGKPLGVTPRLVFGGKQARLALKCAAGRASLRLAFHKPELGDWTK